MFNKYTEYFVVIEIANLLLASESIVELSFSIIESNFRELLQNFSKGNSSLKIFDKFDSKRTLHKLMMSSSDVVSSI